MPAVEVDTYNEELRDADGFVGDHASKAAFRKILDDWRSQISAHCYDPFGDTPTDEISKSKLDEILEGPDPVAAGLVHTAIEEFAKALADVTERFWRSRAGSAHRGRWRHERQRYRQARLGAGRRFACRQGAGCEGLGHHAPRRRSGARRRALSRA